ncbi:MAG: hypothetical protein ACYC1S_16180 [Gemmatimonadaceae bacterium]
MKIFTLKDGETDRCVACGEDAVRLQNLRGRVFELRDENDLVFDEDLVVPVCAACKEFYVRGPTLERFSDALERLHAAKKRATVDQFVEKIEREFADVPRQSWEDALGLSRGYLSRIQRGTRALSLHIEMFMRGVVAEPLPTLKLIKLSRRLPAELEAYLR